MTDITLRALGEEILATFRASYKITDSPDKRLVYHWIQNIRATFLKQRLDKQPLVPIEETYVQSLGVLDLEPLGEDDIADIGLIYGTHFVKRTIEEIPEAIDRNNNLPALTRISLVEDIGKDYTNVPLISQDRIFSAGIGRFNDSDIYAFMHNRRLHLMSRENLEDRVSKVLVKGVFQNPLEAGRIRDPEFGLDSPYPIGRNMIADMKNAVLQANFEIHIQQIEDKIADGEDNITQP